MGMRDFGHIKGIVHEVGQNGTVKVLLPEYDGLVTDWLPVVQSLTLGAKTWAVPRKGTQVIVLPGHGLEDAVVLWAIYSQPDPAPFEDSMVIGIEADDGVVITYDPGASALSIKSPKLIDIIATNVVIQGDIDITGNITHSGDMEQSGNAKRAGTLEQSGNVTINGNTTQSGNMDQNGAITTDSATIGGIKFADHKHPAGTPFTGTPV